MRLNCTHAGAATAGLFAVLLFCATFAGCEHYCLDITSNPGGTIGTTVTCPAPKPTGNVSLSFGSPVAPASDSVPLRTPHIFVTLRGADALPAPLPGDDAPAWQELAPQLLAHPVQVDLMARAADSCATGPLGAAPGPPSPRLGELGVSVVPAGVYTQLRLRLVQNPDPNLPSDRSTTAALPLDESACGADLLNCLIPPDAAAQPLAFDDSAEIVIPSERIAGGFIRVVPDTSVHLVIMLDPRASIALPAATALRFIPSFSVSDSPCSR